MRLIENQQMMLGQRAIEAIEIDVKSRDDIPKVLRGLQYLYQDEVIRHELFTLLEQLIPKKIKRDTGRPGMLLWRIFVLGVLRLNLNCDYDRLQELANQHGTLREMLGHGDATIINYEDYH